MDIKTAVGYFATASAAGSSQQPSDVHCSHTHFTHLHLVQVVPSHSHISQRQSGPQQQVVAEADATPLKARKPNRPTVKIPTAAASFQGDNIALLLY